MALGHGKGAMSFSMKVIRLFIVLFNVAFFITGAVLLAVGSYIIKDPKLQQLRPLLNPDVTAKLEQGFSGIEVFAIAVIVIGSILLLIGFLGCCGAIKTFKCLHILYCIIIGLIIVVEIAITACFVAYQAKFKSEFVSKLQLSIQTQYVGVPVNGTATNAISLAWDFVQYNMKCCGAYNESDYNLPNMKWNKTNPYGGASLMFPLTCCPVNTTEGQNWDQLPLADIYTADTCAVTGVGVYNVGCYDQLVQLIRSYKTKAIIILVFVLAIELVAFLFALSLYCRKSEYNTL